MWDTVRLKFCGIAIDPASLVRRGWEQDVTRRIDSGGQLHESIRLVRRVPGGSPHYVSFYPTSGTLVTEASLPKIVYSQNISMLAAGDVQRALDEWSDRLNHLIGSPTPHPMEWQIAGRADAVYSWQVGDRMGAYLHALAQIPLARHRTESINADSTIYWKNRSRWIRVYDKHAETGLVRARGLLRFEIEMKRPRSELKRFTPTGSIKAQDVLTWNVAQPVLEHYLTALGTDLVVSDEEQVLSMLLQKCGRTKAARLMGFLALTRLRSREDLVRLGFRRNWIWRNSREIAKAGVSAGMVKSGLLPPLLLPDVYDGSPGQV